MPYYAPSAYYPLPGAPQAAALPPQPQQQQQYGGQPAQPQLNQVYLRQQEQAQLQAQQVAYQQQQQYLEQQNRQQLAQQQQYQQQQQYVQLQQQQRLQQQQQLQQQQYAAQQQQRLQQQQGYGQQQQQYQQQAARQQRSASPAAPLYKSSDYIPAGGVYSTGGAYNQPSSLRRSNSRADVNTAIENQESAAAPYQSFGQGQQSLSQYNAYANYGQAVPQSPIRPLGNSQREPSQYADEGLNPVVYKQQQYSQGNPSELGARSLNAPTTVVLDANNNAAAAPLPPRSPARGYGGLQKGYGSGAQAESAYIAIPNDLVYAQNNQQRAYIYGQQESRPVYASSSRTNQGLSTPQQLKPAAARELYAALSSENVRTALERDAPIILAQAPAYSTYNGQKVQGRAFVVPADQKYSEYNIDELNNLRSVIDR